MVRSDATGDADIPRCAIGSVLCVNAVALVLAVVATSAAVAVDVAGPLGGTMQKVVAWAAATVGSGALLGIVTAAGCQRHLYVYFVAQLAAAVGCVWLLSESLSMVNGAVDEIGRATSWADNAEQVLGEQPFELDACTEMFDGDLTDTCWHELRPSLCSSLRRSLLGWGGCVAVLHLLALLATKWALTLPVIVVKTEVTTSYFMLASAVALLFLAIYYHFRVETTFGRRLVFWSAGMSGLLLTLALWGFANTLLARRVGRWSSGVGGGSVACTDSCFGASRLASLAVSLVASISLLVLALACSSRPDSLLRRLEAAVTDDELQQLLYEWQLLNCKPSEAAATAERLGATPFGSQVELATLQDVLNSSLYGGSWSDVTIVDNFEVHTDNAAETRGVDAGGEVSLLSCRAQQLGWESAGMRIAVQAWLANDVQRMCVLCAVVLAVRLLCVGMMIYHADSPAWTVVMDGKRHHLHPSQAIEQVRSTWTRSSNRHRQHVVTTRNVTQRNHIFCARASRSSRRWSSQRELRLTTAYRHNGRPKP